jgi:HlyD family secretion protein
MKQFDKGSEKTSQSDNSALERPPATGQEIVPSDQPLVKAAEDHALVPSPARQRSPRLLRLALLLVGLGAVIAGGAYWYLHRIPPLPAGIVFGNGRIEADPIDIATKFAGRVLELRVDEGDSVTAGQVVAVMDTRDLAASLKKTQAIADQARKSINESKALLEQQHSQVVFAEQEMERARVLVEKGWTTKQTYDQRKQALDAAKATEIAAQNRVNEAEHALEAANHDIEYYQVNIADNTLVAPRDGRIQYRIANVGEVLSAGGKVFTMLDVGNVYMDIYLPTLSAGRVKIGDGARIVLDAYPDRPIPAKVSFIADQAQFTPKMVETQTEREKLMFRIRVRIDQARSKAHANLVRSGLPGNAYVLTDPKVAWPDRLRGPT